MGDVVAGAGAVATAKEEDDGFDSWSVTAVVAKDAGAADGGWSAVFELVFFFFLPPSSFDFDGIALDPSELAFDDDVMCLGPCSFAASAAAGNDDLVSKVSVELNVKALAVLLVCLLDFWSAAFDSTDASYFLVPLLTLEASSPVDAVLFFFDSFVTVVFGDFWLLPLLQLVATTKDESCSSSVGRFFLGCWKGASAALLVVFDSGVFPVVPLQLLVATLIFNWRPLARELGVLVGR